MTTEVNVPIIHDYNYPIGDLPKLKELLEKWNLACVFQTCIGKDYCFRLNDK